MLVGIILALTFSVWEGLLLVLIGRPGLEAETGGSNRPGLPTAEPRPGVASAREVGERARVGRATIYPALPLNGRMVTAAVRTPVSEIAVPEGPGASTPLRPRGAPPGAGGWARSYAPAASRARSNFSLGS